MATRKRISQSLVQVERPEISGKPILPDNGIFVVPVGYMVIDTEIHQMVARAGQTVAIEEKTRGRFKIVPMVAGG